MNRLQARRIVKQLDEVLGANYTDPSTVERVQRALKIPVDGKMGPQTRAAVKAFNIKRGAPQDGENITDGTLGYIAGMEVVAAQRAQEAADIPIYGPPLPAGFGAPAAPKASASVASPATSTFDVNQLFPPAKAEPPTPVIRKEAGMPVWQMVVAGLGVVAIGAGAFMLVRKKR